VIVGVSTDEPPQHPIPPVVKLNAARIGEHVGVPVADGLAEVHGDAENASVVNGQPIVNVMSWPHIFATPSQTLMVWSQTSVTVNAGQSGHVVVTSA
tara:strand:- start:454 stop:744 length:291 start_codon:yes stop_codon:yes gene_type:complete